METETTNQETMRGIRGPTALICSSGRAQELHHRLTQALLQRRSVSVQEVICVSPGIEIGEHDLAFFNKVTVPVPDRNLLIGWLLSGTEGRPGDWFYNESWPIHTLAQDLKRIATLKFRPFALDLLNAHRHGLSAVTRHVTARDTGQVIKIRNRDILRYQSHPGNDILNQVAQKQDLIDSDYALLMTMTVTLAGRFPTETADDIYRTLSLLYAYAHNQKIQPDHLACDLAITASPMAEYSIFRIPHDYFFRANPLAYKNVPGGIALNFHSVCDALEILTDQYHHSVHPVTSNALETFELVSHQGVWERYHDSLFEKAGGPFVFNDMRCGVAPLPYFIQTISQMETFVN